MAEANGTIEAYFVPSGYNQSVERSYLKITWEYSTTHNSSTTTCKFLSSMYVHRDSYGPSQGDYGDCYITVNGTKRNTVSNGSSSPSIGSSYVKVGATLSYTITYPATSTKTISIAAGFSLPISIKLTDLRIPVSSYSRGTGVLVSGSTSITLPKKVSHTACTAPSTIYLGGSSNTTQTSTFYGLGGSTAYLRWSGAKAGTSNSITGYLVYGGTSSNPTTQIKDTTSSSYSFTIPSDGDTRYYRVRTKGSAGSSYYSGYSTQRTLVSCTRPTVSTPTVTPKYGKPSSEVSISWTASNGLNNAIQSYSILQNNKVVKSGITNKYATVTLSSEVGFTDNFKIRAVGKYYDSNDSSAFYTGVYEDIVPEITSSTEVYISLNSSNSTTLTWSVNSGGQYNAITKYTIYRETINDEGSVINEEEYAVITDPNTKSYDIVRHDTINYKYRYRIKLEATLNTSYSSYIRVHNYQTPVFSDLVFSKDTGFILDPLADPLDPYNCYSLADTTDTNITADLVTTGGVNNGTAAMIFKDSEYLGTTVISPGGSYYGNFSYEVQAPSIDTEYYEFYAIPLGTRANGAQTNTIKLYSCTRPTIDTIYVNESSTYSIKVNNNFIISYTANDGIRNPISGYRIYAVKDNISTSLGHTTDNSINTKILESGVYNINVVAVGKKGYNSIGSNQVATITVIDYTAPSNLSFSVEDGSIVTQNNQISIGIGTSSIATLSWNDIDNIYDSYKIHTVDYSTGSDTVIGTTSSKVYNINIPTLSGSYFYYVEGIIDGFRSYNSNSTEMIIYQSNINPPIDIDINGEDHAIVKPGTPATISFHGASITSPDTITGYDLYRKEVYSKDNSTKQDYILLSHIDNTTSNGSFDVTSPDINNIGVVYYYHIKTIGQTQSGSKTESQYSSEIYLKSSLYRYVQSNSEFKEIVSRYVYTNGQWRHIVHRYVYTNGQWKQIF